MARRRDLSVEDSKEIFGTWVALQKLHGCLGQGHKISVDQVAAETHLPREKVEFYFKAHGR